MVDISQPLVDISQPKHRILQSGRLFSAFLKRPKMGAKTFPECSGFSESLPVSPDFSDFSRNLRVSPDFSGSVPESPESSGFCRNHVKPRSAFRFLPIFPSPSRKSQGFSGFLRVRPRISRVFRFLPRLVRRSPGSGQASREVTRSGQVFREVSWARGD